MNLFDSSDQTMDLELTVHSLSGSSNQATPNWSPTYEKWYSTTLQKLVYMQADFEMVKAVQYTLLSTHKVQAVMGNH
jgi:hypothetical protein